MDETLEKSELEPMAYYVVLMGRGMNVYVTAMVLKGGKFDASFERVILSDVVLYSHESLKPLNVMTQNYAARTSVKRAGTS